MRLHPPLKFPSPNPPYRERRTKSTYKDAQKRLANPKHTKEREERNLDTYMRSDQPLYSSRSPEAHASHSTAGSLSNRNSYAAHFVLRPLIPAGDNHELPTNTPGHDGEVTRPAGNKSRKFWHLEYDNISYWPLSRPAYPVVCLVKPKSCAALAASLLALAVSRAQRLSL